MGGRKLVEGRVNKRRVESVIIEENGANKGVLKSWIKIIISDKDFKYEDSVLVLLMNALYHLFDGKV